MDVAGPPVDTTLVEILTFGACVTGLIFSLGGVTMAGDLPRVMVGKRFTKRWWLPGKISKLRREKTSCAWSCGNGKDENVFERRRLGIPGRTMGIHGLNKVIIPTQVNQVQILLDD